MDEKFYKKPHFISEKEVDEPISQCVHNSLSILREVSFAESANEFDFSDKFTSEKSVFMMIKRIGFDINLDGTEYLMDLLCTVLDEMKVPSTKNKMMSAISKRQNSLNCSRIEAALNEAIEKNEKLNYVNFDDENSKSYKGKKNNDLYYFLTSICTRILMMKTHKMGQNFFD